MALSPSVVVNGIDLRTRFEFEVTNVTNLHAVRFRRSELQTSWRHGVISEGGSYEPIPVTISGEVATANRMALVRALFSDTRYPSDAKARNRIQFADNPTVSYEFDTAELVEFERVQPWRITEVYKVTITFYVTQAFPTSMLAPTMGTSMVGASASFAGGSAAMPTFAFLPLPDGTPPLAVRSGRLRVFGPATNPTLVSAERGAVYDFDGTLVGKNTLGADATAVIWGVQDANLLTDGDMEASGVTAWTASSATAAKVAMTADLVRIVQGHQALRVALTGANGYVRHSFTAAASKELYVGFWLFRQTYAGGSVTLNVGPAGSPVLTVADLGVTGEWAYYSYTVPTGAGGTWVVEFMGDASGKTFYVDDCLAANSLITSGSMEAGFTGGVPSGWTASGGSHTDETTLFHSGAHAWAMNMTAGLDFYASLGSLTGGSLYHLSFWVRYVSGTSPLSVWVTNSNLKCQIGVAAGGYVRVSLHFMPTSNGTCVLHLSAGATLSVIVDDVAAIALSAKTGTDTYHFEPGVYGRRLQLQTCEAVKLTDFVNPNGNTISAQISPRFNGNGFGSALLWLAAGEPLSGWDGFALLWSEADGAFDFQKAVASAITRVVGDSVSATLEPFQGTTKRGCMGIVTRFSDGQIAYPLLGAGMKLYVERESSLDTSFDVDAETNTSTAATAPAGTPAVIILSDACIWDAFWVHQYPREFPERDLFPPNVPANTNRTLAHTGTLALGESLLIDLETYSIEKWDSDADPATAAKLTNAAGNTTGDPPEWEECPVLMVPCSIPAIQAVLKAEVA